MKHRLNSVYAVVYEELHLQDYCVYKVSQKERSIFWKVIVILDKTVDKKEILRTVSNTGIYCSSDKVGTVYLV
jgi:predicted transport protein